MPQRESGKISARDEAMARVLRWSPWLAFVLISLPLPLVFLLLFISANATDAAALYLLLALSSLGLSLVVALLAVITLFLYKRSWLRRLRDRLAADGIS
jgi:amino acid transporter